MNQTVLAILPLQTLPTCWPTISPTTLFAKTAAGITWIRVARPSACVFPSRWQRERSLPVLKPDAVGGYIRSDATGDDREHSDTKRLHLEAEGLTENLLRRPEAEYIPRMRR